MTEDERYKQLQNEKQTALNEASQTYDNLLKENTALSNNVNDYLNQYQTTQSGIYDSQLQREQEKADLRKKKAEEEFNKEAIASKNAYYDFTNPYGVQRELQVQQGLGNSGYSETVKSQAWTTQQNRTAQARATMNQAKLQFDEDMKDARLNNDVLKAQLALDTLRMKQDETLRNFNYRSDIMQTRLANAQNLSSEYNNRYNTVWNQINTENQQKEAARQYEKDFAESQRQFDTKMAYQKERDKVADNQWEREYALSQQKVNGSGGNDSLKKVTLLEDNPVLNDNTTETSNVPWYVTLSKNAFDATNNTIKSAINSINNPQSNNTNVKLTPVANLNPAALSSTVAKNLYNSSIAGKNLTYNQLANILDTGFKNGSFTQNDIKVISNLYKETR